MSRGGLYVYRWAAEHPETVRPHLRRRARVRRQELARREGPRPRAVPRNGSASSEVYGLTEEQADGLDAATRSTSSRRSRPAKIPILHLRRRRRRRHPRRREHRRRCGAALTPRPSAVACTVDRQERRAGTHPHSLTDAERARYSEPTASAAPAARGSALTARRAGGGERADLDGLVVEEPIAPAAGGEDHEKGVVRGDVEQVHGQRGMRRRWRLDLEPEELLVYPRGRPSDRCDTAGTRAAVRRRPPPADPGRPRMLSPLRPMRISRRARAVRRPRAFEQGVRERARPTASRGRRTHAASSGRPPPPPTLSPVICPTRQTRTTLPSKSTSMRSPVNRDRAAAGPPLCFRRGAVPGVGVTWRAPPSTRSTRPSASSDPSAVRMPRLSPQVTNARVPANATSRSIGGAAGFEHSGASAAAAAAARRTASRVGMGFLV